MKTLFIICLLILVNMANALADEAPPQPLMKQVGQLVQDLALSDGFTDEDASQVSVYFLEKLAGPKPDKQTLSVQVRESAPESVTVFAGYDFGFGFTGYEFHFKRGDPAKGMRYAIFWSLTVVPSE